METSNLGTRSTHYCFFFNFFVLVCFIVRCCTLIAQMAGPLLSCVT